MFGGLLAGARAAAVVLPIIFGREPVVIALLRASHLSEHAGEVGFPGGKPETADADLRATALREMEEEIGVSSADTTVLGVLTPTPVISGRWLIHPFVASITAPPRITSAEATRLVALPIARHLDGSVRMQSARSVFRGTELLSPHFRHDGTVLYGASAYLYYELLVRVAACMGRELPAPELEEGLPWGARYAEYG